MYAYEMIRMLALLHGAAEEGVNRPLAAGLHNG